MGFNIGTIIAGGAIGATKTMRNRMNAHEKTLAEEKRLRTSAEIQTEFEEKSAEKKEKRQAERDAAALRNLGYEPELVAKFLRGGEASITQASQWAVDALKKGVNVNTIYKASSVKGANLNDDTQQINNIMNVASEDDGSETVSAFGLDPDVLKTIYAPKPTDKSLDALYADAVKREIDALKRGNDGAYLDAKADKSAYLLSMQQKHAANSKADKKFEPFSKPSMTETFKLEEQRALEALEAVGLVEGIRQTIDGSKQLRGLSNLYQHKYTGESGLNIDADGEPMSEQFEAMRRMRLRAGKDILVDYALDPNDDKNIFRFENNTGEDETIFSYEDAIKYQKRGQIKVGQIVKVKVDNKYRTPEGKEYSKSGIAHLVYLGQAFKDNGSVKTGDSIMDNFFKAAFFPLDSQ